jgi:hypothetical protein
MIRIWKAGSSAAPTYLKELYEIRSAEAGVKET